MKTYKDYIGVKLEYVIGPYQYRSAQAALEDRLKYYIKNELTYYNGLVCDFKNIQTEISAGMIIVSGTVTQCEVNR